jgi:hypothetical protein
MTRASHADEGAAIGTIPYLYARRCAVQTSAAAYRSSRRRAGHRSVYLLNIPPTGHQAFVIRGAAASFSTRPFGISAPSSLASSDAFD